MPARKFAADSRNRPILYTMQYKRWATIIEEDEPSLKNWKEARAQKTTSPNLSGTASENKRV